MTGERARHSTRTVRLRALALSVSLAGLLAAFPNTPTGAESTSGATLPDSAWIMDHVRFFADDICEGRGIGTEGLAIAADHIEKEFRELGLAPGGADGTYRQEVQIVQGVELASPTELVLDGIRFRPERDFNPLGFSTSGAATAGVVFAGYGITASEHGYNDYAGLDVEGKIVLLLRYEPGEQDPNSPFGGDVHTPHAFFRTKAINAREHGAKGILIVTGPRYHDDGDELIPIRNDAGFMSSGILAAHITPRIANQLLRGSEWSLRDVQDYIDIHYRPKSFPLDKQVSLEIRLDKRFATVENVLGVLPGTEPSRTMVFGAHYDHLGKSGAHSLARDADGKIHYGADDNASGTAAMLSLARAWTSRPAPPRHNLVFAAFAAEELGLLGSAHYVEHPTYPIEETEFMFNFDMVGRLRQDRLMMMGSGTAVGLDSLVTEIGGAYNLDLQLSRDGFGPSDHTSFYKKRIPVLAFFTGVHRDYHRPSDTVVKVNGKGIERIANFALEISEALDAQPAIQYVEMTSPGQFRQLGGVRGSGAYLGTVPDYSREEGGVLLSRVIDEGPAESAGLRGGDIIVELDGLTIDNVYDLTFILRTRKPGQIVDVVVLRDERERTFSVTLGHRQ